MGEIKINLSFPKLQVIGNPGESSKNVYSNNSWIPASPAGRQALRQLAEAGMTDRDGLHLIRPFHGFNVFSY